jgi:hypothetical protein
VVDPRRTEPARRADAWLQVRPGTDGALALGIAGVMIEHGWFDEPFIREWTNGPLLVRSDTGRFLTEADLSAGGDPGRYMAWDGFADRPAVYDPARGRYEADLADLALFGEHTLETPKGGVRCRTALDLAAALCRTYTPERVESITGVERGEVERAARLLWEARPLAYYAWSGVEMQTSSTQIARAIAQLYALTGSFDSPGGNVLFAAPPEKDLEWQDAGVDGMFRFISRVFRFVTRNAEKAREGGERTEADVKALRKLHQTLKKVTEDFDSRWHFNTSIAAVMELMNVLHPLEPQLSGPALAEVIEKVVLMLAPFIPYVTQEMWTELGRDGQVFHQTWPCYDPELAREEEAEIPVQVNGKLRSRIYAAFGTSKEDLERQAREDEKVQQFIRGKQVVKVIVVPDKLVNLVVKG